MDSTAATYSRWFLFEALSNGNNLSLVAQNNLEIFDAVLSFQRTSVEICRMSERVMEHFSYLIKIRYNSMNQIESQ